MPKRLIVSAADAKFFPLLRDCIASIRSFPELSDLEMRAFDLGMAPDHLAWLASMGVQTVAPKWDLDFPNRAAAPETLKALTVRPYLPGYFPDCDIIMWLDADIWVQRPEFLRLYFTAAERYGYAATPEIDRSYEIMFGAHGKYRTFHHQTYYRCFGREMADRLIEYPLINNGAFAIRRDHPVWGAWRDAYFKTMQTTPLIHAEQATLNLVVHNGGENLKPHMLPSLANWVCGQALPLWDGPRKKLVETNLPHDVLGLVHMTGLHTKDMELFTVDGRRITMSLTYSAVRALCERA